MNGIVENRIFVRKTALLSLVHAAVDLACAALFFSVLQGDDLWLGMVLYNACAFLCQLPMGVLADRLNRNMLFAAVGCVLVALAFGFRSVPILAMVIAGLGNGAFHVGGGIEVLNGSEKKAGPLGVFVSPGAIGLYFGRVFSGGMLSLPWLLPAILLGFGAAILLLGKREFSEGSHNADLSFDMPKGGIWLLTLLFLVVVLRSFMGTTEAFSTGEFLSGSDPLDVGDAVPYAVPALAFDEAGVPYVDIAYPALKPGVVLTYELQRKLSLADDAWETVASHEVKNDGVGAVFYSEKDGVNAHMSEPGAARMLPADQAEGVDFSTGFYRIKIYADYGKMVDNDDGTWSYWTWVRTGTNVYVYKEAARGTGTLVRDADGNWSFVSDASGLKETLVRGEDGSWTFQK